jgi:GntR family transcriptional regulator / MocR family aminotransferase
VLDGGRPEFLRETRGLPISAENVLITRWAQMAFFISARLLVKPGDHVSLGTPGYTIIEALFRRLGAVIDRIPVDDHGSVIYVGPLATTTFFSGL